MDTLQNALASNWRSYRDSEGNNLRVRPHWAKEFPREVRADIEEMKCIYILSFMKVGGQDIYDYMRDVYRDQIPLFMEGMNKIMERTGGKLTSSLAMFSTKYLDSVFQGYF